MCACVESQSDLQLFRIFNFLKSKLTETETLQNRNFPNLDISVITVYGSSKSLTPAIIQSSNIVMSVLTKL